MGDKVKVYREFMEYVGTASVEPSPGFAAGTWK